MSNLAGRTAVGTPIGGVPEGVYFLAGKEVMGSCWEKDYCCPRKLFSISSRSRLSWEKNICCDGYSESTYLFFISLQLIIKTKHDFKSLKSQNARASY